MHGDLLPSNIQRSLQAIGKRQMVLPVLLLLASHRPLAFVSGQMLYLCAPVAEMLVGSAWSDWAEVLSAPNGPQLLERYLRTQCAVHTECTLRAEYAQEETEQST